MNKVAYELGRKLAEELGPFDRAMASRVHLEDALINAAAYNRDKHTAHYLLNPYVSGPLTEGLRRLGRRAASSLAEHPYAYLGLPTAGALGGAALAGYSHKNKSFWDRNKITPGEATGMGMMGASALAPLIAMIAGGDETQNKARAKFKAMDSKSIPSKEAAELGPYDADAYARQEALRGLVKADVLNRQNNFAQYLLNPFVPGPLSEFVGHRLGRRMLSAFDSDPYLYHPLHTLLSVHPVTGAIMPIAGMIAGDEKKQKGLLDQYKKHKGTYQKYQD